MEFAIKLSDEEEGRWVLSVDPIGERFLTTNDDQEFRWVDMADCLLIKVKTPEMPQPVVMLQPQGPLAVPGLHLGAN